MQIELIRTVDLTALNTPAIGECFVALTNAYDALTKVGAEIPKIQLVITENGDYFTWIVDNEEGRSLEDLMDEVAAAIETLRK